MPFPSHHRKHLFTGVIVVLAVLLISMIGAVAWAQSATSAHTILSGVRVLDTDLGGKTRDQAVTIIEQLASARWQEGVRVRWDGGSGIIPYDRRLAQINAAQLAQEAYNVGREGTLLSSSARAVQARIGGVELAPRTSVQRDELRSAIATSLQTLLPAAKNAHLVPETLEDGSTTLRIEPHVDGYTFDDDALIEAIAQHMTTFSNDAVEAHVVHQNAEITASDLEPLAQEARQWLSKNSYTLISSEKKTNLEASALANLITTTTTNEGVTTLDLQDDALASVLRERFQDILRPSKDGRLSVNPETKAILSFEQPVQGYDLDLPTSKHNLLASLRAGSSTADIVFQSTTPKILGDAQSLGIEEIVGVGRSNFSGSPTNRRKNIALGAKHVNFTLVPPGEEFSMIGVLGEIDGAHGWFPELVIKGNQTLPEYGGGLCQVGTTMFRAALSAGLPITERRNHSYRVRYYEPAGTDATIYDPAPDFKFKNDMPNWIMVTTEVRGDELIFSVWGKKDGRVAVQTTPRVWNIVAPPPTKYIDTTELAPGKIKCVESAHAGADAQFEYTVTYPNGEVVEKEFFSRYKPWQEVCMRGVESLTPAAEQAAQSVDQTGVNNPNL